MNKGKNILSVKGAGFLRLCIPAVGLILALTACTQASRSDIPEEKIREYANELYNRALYTQALEQYQTYLENYSLDSEESASVGYRIAGIYFDRLFDYENALAQYLRVKTLFPNSPLVPEVNKKIIACLERLERPEDARQALKESADLEPPVRESLPGTVIAVIGERRLTQEDLDFEISQLPPEIRSQYGQKDKKLEFLRRFIATELMYDSAKRAGLDQDKDVIAGVFQAKKSLMVQKLLMDQIRDRVKFEEQDVDLYYRANRDKYSEKDENGQVVRTPPLEEIKETVARDLFMERQQQALDEWMTSLLQAENVKIFDDLVK